LRRQESVTLAVSVSLLISAMSSAPAPFAQPPRKFLVTLSCETADILE